MTGDARSDDLAQRVAAAAAAWLRDPHDTGAYGRLVTATAAWEAHAHPTLDGLERAGAVPDVATIRAAVLAVMEQLRSQAEIAALVAAHREGEGPPSPYPADWPWEPQPPDEPREDPAGYVAAPPDAPAEIVIDGRQAADEDQP